MTKKTFAGEIGYALLRVFAGLSIAFGHGIGKLPPSDGFVDGVANLGFPLPILFAWMAGITEFFGGILVALGVLTRPAAAMLAITMFVAAFLRHASDPFSGKEKALLFLAIFVMYFLAGPGKYSLERFRK